MSDSNVKGKAMGDARVEKEIIEYAVKIMDYANTKLESISMETIVGRNSAKGEKVKVKSKSADKPNTEKRPASITYETKGPIDYINAEKENVNNTNTTNGTFTNANAKNVENDNTNSKKGITDKASEKKEPFDCTKGGKCSSDTDSSKKDHTDKVSGKKGHSEESSGKNGHSEESSGKKSHSEESSAKKGPVEQTNGKKASAENTSGNKGAAGNVAAKGRSAKISKQKNRPVVNTNSKKELCHNAMAKGRPDDLMNLARAKLLSALDANSKKGSVSNASLKMGPVLYGDLKKGSLSNTSIKKEPVDNVKKNKIVHEVNKKDETTDDLHAGKISVDDPNSQEVSVDNSNAKEVKVYDLNVMYDLDPEEENKLAGRCLVFIRNLEQYLTRCYDMVKQGFSVIEEHHTNLLPSCKVLLRGCLDSYKNSPLFPSYVTYAECDNRSTVLKTAVKEVLISTGREENHAEFLRISALYILLGFDLNRMTPFWDAPDFIIEAIIEAIMATKQRNFIFLWFTKK